MSPEQRAQMEKMMGGRMGAAMGGGAAAPAPVYTKTGKRSKAGGYDCEIVTYEVVGQKGEMCVAKADALDLPSSDVKTLQQFGAFMEKMSSQMLQGSVGEPMNISQIGGLPVRSKHGEQPARVLQSVSHDSLPASLFQVPSGFTKQEMMPAAKKP